MSVCRLPQCVLTQSLILVFHTEERTRFAAVTPIQRYSPASSFLRQSNKPGRRRLKVAVNTKERNSTERDLIIEAVELGQFDAPKASPTTGDKPSNVQSTYLGNFEKARHFICSIEKSFVDIQRFAALFFIHVKVFF
jgi:hypothetical protein